MKPRKAIAMLLLLLVSSGAVAEGGKQRGDEGQGSIVQDQVRVVVPPAQWTATTTLPAASEAEPDETQDEAMEEDAETLF